MKKNVKNVLVFFSNPYIFEDQVLPVLLAIVKKHSIFVHVLLPERNCSVRLTSLLTDLVGEGRLASFRTVRWGNLRRELDFWKTAYRDFERIIFDSILLGSESFLSDLVAMSLGRESQKVVVFPAQIRIVESGVSWFSNALSTNIFRRPVHTLIGYSKNLLYRHRLGRFFEKITGEKLTIRPARRFIGEGNSDYYILSGQAHSVLGGQALDNEKFVSARFSGTLRGPEDWTNSCLLLAPDNPGWWKQRRYLASLSEELSVLAPLAQISKIVVRPHPTFMSFASRAIESLEINVPVSFSESTGTLYSELSCHSLVVGSVSAALDYAGELPGLKVVSLLDSGRALNGGWGVGFVGRGVAKWSLDEDGPEGLSALLGSDAGKFPKSDTDRSREFSEILESVYGLPHH